MPGETAKRVEVTATYDRDSKRYHRFIVDDDQAVVGNIYVPKGSGPEVLEVLVRLRTPGDREVAQ